MPPLNPDSSRQYRLFSYDKYQVLGVIDRYQVLGVIQSQFVCLMAIRLHFDCNSFAHFQFRHLQFVCIFSIAIALGISVRYRFFALTFVGQVPGIWLPGTVSFPHVFRLQFVASCWQVVCILVRYRLVNQRSLSRFKLALLSEK